MIDVEYVFAMEFTGLEGLNKRELLFLYVCLCGEGGRVNTQCPSANVEIIGQLLGIAVPFILLRQSLLVLLLG